MPARKDVSGGEGRGGRHAVEEQNMIGRGDEEDACAGTRGGKVLLGLGRGRSFRGLLRRKDASHGGFEEF